LLLTEFIFYRRRALRDAEGNYRITGRVDDVLNVSGHRIGTAEVENAINMYPDVWKARRWFSARYQGAGHLRIRYHEWPAPVNAEDKEA